MTPASHERLSEEEYLRRERDGLEKHEWVNGEVISMAAGSARHALISANLTSALNAALRHRPCAVLSSDQRVNVSATGLYAYPDVTVFCGRPEFHAKDPNTLTNPSVVVEVLSDATESFDRGAKFAYFQRLASLQEYVLVAQHGRRVEHYRRADVGQWLLTIVEGTGDVRFTSLDVAISLEDVYAKLELLTPS